MTIYAKLLRLPFFQGIDRDELEAMASKIRFDFQKYDEGAWIARENDRCATLTLVMTGSVEAEAISADHSYSLRELIDAPCAIEPERIFGLRQHLARGYRATTPCNVLRLQKDDVLRLCAQSLVFELNVLNTISTSAQRAGSAFWRTPPTTIPRKIATFVAHRSLRPAGPKTLSIRLTDLGSAIGESRLNVSRSLHGLEAQGLVALARQTIIIHRLEQLLSVEDDAPSLLGSAEKRHNNIITK
uniref:Crp/Fnr family transcriptional regulator n=2 Tax=Prevotella sp. TaxID=59823 RepID=UPI004025A0E3